MSYFQPLKTMVLLPCLALILALIPQTGEGAQLPEPPNLAGVLADGKWGYIDASGKFVLPPIYEEARPFSRAGVAIVKTAGHNSPDDGWALVDPLGKTVPLPGTPYAPVVGSSGLVAVEHQGNWSIADLAGNSVPLPPLSEDEGKLSFAACFFSKPYCKVVRRAADGESGESLVDAAGREVVPPGYEQLNLPFGGKYLIATDTNKKDWLLSLEGQVLGGPFDYIAYANEENACVMRDGRFGLMSMQDGVPQKFVIPPDFDDVIIFQDNGLAAVEKAGLYGVIDRNGRFVLPPTFAVIQVLSGGWPWVASQDGEKFGLIGENGEFIHDRFHDDFFNLLPGGQAVFKSGQKWTLTDRQGFPLKAPVYDAVGQSTAGGGLTAVCIDQLWGFVDAKGQLVIEPRFEDTTEAAWSTQTGSLKTAKALNREAVKWIRAGRPNPLSER